MMEPQRSAHSIQTRRGAVFVAGSVVVIAAGLLSAGCSKSTAPAPAPSSSSPRSVSVQPTEKGAISGKTPPRAYNPSMNAADGIAALESEGYNVEINWGGGRTDQNLSLCRIGSVDGLRGSGAVIPGTSVYVTVIC